MLSFGRSAHRGWQRAAASRRRFCASASSAQAGASAHFPLAKFDAAGAVSPHTSGTPVAAVVPVDAMATSYSPGDVEAGWYEWWAGSDYFTEEVAAREAAAVAAVGGGDGTQQQQPVFSMVLPPPNITGVLHIGHALTVTVQDALCRWRRMRGDRVLWIPGLDHAGIATQSVVERALARREPPLSRHELGREAFVAEVQAWKEQHGGRINGQMKRLGASLDWPRAAFTLDKPRSRAVADAFVRLHDQGLVERRRRIVNWCPALSTTISDIEVERLEVDGPTMLTLPAAAEPVSQPNPSLPNGSGSGGGGGGSGGGGGGGGGGNSGED